MNFSDCIRTLAELGSRAFWSVISKIKNLKDVTYKACSTLYNTQILHIVQSTGIWHFMGVHGFTSAAAVSGKMGWSPCKYRRYLCMFRLCNRLIKMELNRLLKLVCFWDLNSSKSSYSNTVTKVCDILNI